MDPRRLEAYADLIVRKGLNLDPGQEVLLIAELDQIDFVRMVVEKCYLAGAGRVVVDYHDMPIEKLHCIYQDEKVLSQVPGWEISRWKWRAERLPALLWLDSDDPDGMAGVDQGKRTRAQAARFPAIKAFREATENRHQWCIAGVPGKAWARKVFPGRSDEDAEEALWDAILNVSRTDGNPIANWDEHNRTIHRHCDELNRRHFIRLEYHSSNGTDFSVGLMEQGIFCGASETDLNGRTFNPNIPSEEVFTTPKKGEAEGLLTATRPLSWQGALIEDFSIRFHAGKVCEIHAARGQEALEKMIAMDEGASYLGECALIAYDSPVNRTGLLFYSTLYDENACCHVALGRGFYDCIRDYQKYTLDEMRAMGVNDSMNHVDFMIGSEDLSVTGITRSGERIPVFRNGLWCEG